MCTIKLNLPKAARRLYTMDGELITDMKQLLVPYYPELTYLKDGRHQVRGGFSSSFPVLSNFPENLVWICPKNSREKFTFLCFVKYFSCNHCVQSLFPSKSFSKIYLLT